MFQERVNFGRGEIWLFLENFPEKRKIVDLIPTQFLLLQIYCCSFCCSNPFLEHVHLTIHVAFHVEFAHEMEKFRRNRFCNRCFYLFPLLLYYIVLYLMNFVMLQFVEIIKLFMIRLGQVEVLFLDIQIGFFKSDN